MADFCGSCGTQLRAGAKFCQSCGAVVQQPAPPSSTASLPPTLPISAVSPPPAATPYSSGYEPMAYAPPSVPMPPERPKSRGRLKAVLITLAIFMVLVVGSGIGVAIFFAKKAQEIGRRVERGELPFPNVSSKSGAVTEESLGLPIYQPSTPLREGEQVKGGWGKWGVTSAVGSFSTEDDADAVADFYRERMQGSDNFHEVKKGEGGEITLVVNNKQGTKTVVIKPHGSNGQTEFTIISVSGTIPDGFPPGTVPHPPPPPAPPAQPGAPQ